MEPRSEVRRFTRSSIRPPTDHYQHSRPEAESSDEDDDDIPANKIPSVSPPKRHSISSTRTRANQTKRSLSDAARGGIVLYPGSKRQRNGYNMPPVAREPLQNSTLNSSCIPMAAVQTSARTESLSLGPEDDVSEGLVQSVNDAIRRQPTYKTQDYTERRLYQAGVPASPLLREVGSVEQEEDGARIDDQDFGLPPPILNGTNERRRQNASTKPASIGATLNRENQEEMDVGLRVDNTSLPAGDAWDIPNSPAQLNVQEEPPDNSSHIPQPVRKRGRPPKLPKASDRAELLPNETPTTEKRKLGRPRKHYPRLCNEPDNDYIIRIARLRKKPIPYMLDLDAPLPRNSSPAPNATGLIQFIAANQPDQISQGDSTDTLTQGQRLDGSQQPCVQAKVEPEEGAAQPINNSEPDVEDPNDERNRDLSRNDDGSAQHEASEPDGSEYDDTDDNEDESISHFIDGFDTDSVSNSVTDQPAEESFNHDIDVFNARRTRHVEVEDFEAPSDDDVLAIHLDHQPLKQLCKLLRDASWAKNKANWESRPFNYDGAETKPARALLPVLTKLERLYQSTPKAPYLKAQNQFLRKHADMLRYYFHKITIVVDHIRTQRLRISEQTESTNDANSGKRKRITQDLVLYVIPMLAHVLASAWDLGGKSWPEASFTSTTVELLRRALGWIMLLHPRLLEELERCPLEEEPDNPRRRQAWLSRNSKRQEIDPLLDDLYQVITAAPDQLAEMEGRAERELRRRERQRRREERLEKQRKIEQKMADEAMQASVAERKKRSLLSIHGIHYPFESSATSSQPSPSLSLRSTEWSIEEQRILFLRIQASFPTCPDLKNLRWELNKTVAQTVAMTEEILGKMLAKVLVGYSPEEQAAELRQIMSTSGVAEL